MELITYISLQPLEYLVFHFNANSGTLYIVYKIVCAELGVADNLELLVDFLGSLNGCPNTELVFC